ncbi:MAG TPA: hypothetical protein PLI06_01225 [Methanofastidiosum sp.]|nr:hypothetical protein [Methanofastidiosum sp.]
MDKLNLESFIKSFSWNSLPNIYGSGHNSIIGLISTEWIKKSDTNTVLDGAPSAFTGAGRIGQKNADLILCKNQTPLFVVEVETTANKYLDKLNSIVDYLKNKEEYDLIAGLMIMTNYCAPCEKAGLKYYKHNWKSIQEKIISDYANYSFILVSIEKDKEKMDKKIKEDNIRNRNSYHPWKINNIEYWIKEKDNNEITGKLY